MRVGFYLADQNPHRDRTLGITAYTAALLKQFAEGRNPSIHLLASRSSYAGDEGMSNRSVLPWRTDHSLGRIFSDQTHPLFDHTAVDLWHYSKGFLPGLGRFKRPVVGTVCDVILQHYADRYPQARSRVDYQYWLWMLRRSIERFDLILTISEFSCAQILDFAQRYRLRVPPVVVTYLATMRREPAMVEKRNAVVHLASSEPHKRTHTLLEYWRHLEETDASELRLELIGSLTERDRALAQSLKRVTCRGRVGAEELQERLAAARALLLPSEIEGFGLPALESYEAGTPVIYARGTAVAEVLGADAPGGFDLESADSFRAALEETLKLETRFIAKKRNALREKFSWEKCAAETADAYRSVL